MLNFTKLTLNLMLSNVFYFLKSFKKFFNVVMLVLSNLKNYARLSICVNIEQINIFVLKRL